MTTRWMVLITLAVSWGISAFDVWAEPVSPSSSVSTPEARGDIGRPLDAATLQIRQHQEAYARAIEAELAELSPHIRVFQSKLEELQQKQAVVRIRLEALRRASVETWEDAKPGVRAALEELRDAVNEASTRITEVEDRGARTWRVVRGSRADEMPAIRLDQGETMKGIVSVLLVGLFTGWLAGLMMKGRGFGMIGDILVGMIGAVVGGWLFGILGVAAYGTVGFLIMTLVGAIVLLGLLSVVKRA